MKDEGGWSAIYLALANRGRQALMEENVWQIARSNYSAMMIVALHKIASGRSPMGIGQSHECNPYELLDKPKETQE